MTEVTNVPRDHCTRRNTRCLSWRHESLAMTSCLSMMIITSPSIATRLHRQNCSLLANQASSARNHDHMAAQLVQPISQHHSRCFFRGKKQFPTRLPVERATVARYWIVVVVVVEGHIRSVTAALTSQRGVVFAHPGQSVDAVYGRCCYSISDWAGYLMHPGKLLRHRWELRTVHRVVFLFVYSFVFLFFC